MSKLKPPCTPEIPSGTTRYTLACTIVNPLTNELLSIIINPMLSGYPQTYLQGARQVPQTYAIKGLHQRIHHR